MYSHGVPNDTVPFPASRNQVGAGHTRERLLNAAGEVFAARGYRARLEDIAFRAGTSTGPVFHHFAGKARLAQAVIQEQRMLFLNLERVALNASVAPLDALYTLVASMGEEMATNPIVRGALRLNIEGTPQCSYSGWVRTFETLFAAAEMSGEIILPLSPLSSARMLVCTLLGTQTHTDAPTPDECVQWWRTLLTHDPQPQPPTEKRHDSTGWAETGSAERGTS